ncbi:phytanoyl-CoA dioxygenase family protein [Motilimonas sp. E26]|uniref:phytanoyl-CoA dioxygenase family protein n=1 Tax=Motilimonas sp. E26 TaxID=2865674 RepID=UPI001E4DD5C0|nr:phytanoyl-CoA dioxygenase family protein [Motilimonas sp. E26]MCE0556404.1 phytanoyl-CoA dioxygenase family protein [Motilimonas sp. E26]
MSKQYRTLGHIPYTSADAESYYGPVKFHTMEKKLPLRVLSEEDWAFWQENGYVVIKQAISRDAALATLDFSFDFLGYSKTDPDTWYQLPDFKTVRQSETHAIGLMEAYHHQLLWDNRQNQRVYDAFVDVWDTDELWVSLDRVNMNPPNIRNRKINPFIHWDINTTENPMPLRIQGVLAINDSSPKQGGFQCIPSLFKEYDEWVKTQPEDRSPIIPELSAHHKIIVPQLEAGDLLIFNGLLAHGIAANFTENEMRAIQYMAMMPAIEEHQDLINERVYSWATNNTPTWNESLVGDPVKHEKERYGQASLTPLGEKLLGKTSWQTGESLVDVNALLEEKSKGGRTPETLMVKKETESA